MISESALDFMSGLSQQEKASFLVRLSFELTIAARSTYVPDSEDLENPHRLRSFNELQHRIVSAAAGLMGGSPSFSDEAIVQMVFDGEDPEMQSECVWAFNSAAKRFVPEVVLA